MIINKFTNNLKTNEKWKRHKNKKQEVIERVLEILKNEYKDCKDFSCIISVNDEKQTGTMFYGSLTDLMHNITGIENNKGYVMAKEMKKMIEEFQD